MENTSVAPALVGEHEACKFLDISVSVLRRDRAKPRLKIPLVRIGGSVRYRLDDLRKWVESQVIHPPSETDDEPVQAAVMPMQYLAGRFLQVPILPEHQPEAELRSTRYLLIQVVRSIVFPTI